MATLSLTANATGSTTACFSGQFTGGDSSYSYQRYVHVIMSGYGTFDIYSSETGGASSTFYQPLTGLSAGTTYTWSAVLYYRTTGGWVASNYTASGSFATTTQTYTYYGYLTFNANGGTGGPVSTADNPAWMTSTSTWGYVTCTIPSNQPTRTGYTFAGWATNEEGTGTIRYPGGTCTFASYSKVSPGTPFALYAVWQRATYSVTVVYDANGGTGAPSSQTATGTTQYLSLTLSSVKPTRSGYTFLGWSTSSTATSATYDAGQYLSSVYATTAGYEWKLYAVWAQNTSGQINVWYNGAWKSATPYVWYNGTWKLATPYVWYNGVWKLPS